MVIERALEKLRETNAAKEAAALSSSGSTQEVRPDGPGAAQRYGCCQLSSDPEAAKSTGSATQRLWAGTTALLLHFALYARAQSMRCAMKDGRHLRLPVLAQPKVNPW